MFKENGEGGGEKKKKQETEVSNNGLVGWGFLTWGSSGWLTGCHFAAVSSLKMAYAVDGSLGVM